MLKSVAKDQQFQSQEKAYFLFFSKRKR